jgi:hypothetical protein
MVTQPFRMLRFESWFGAVALILLLGFLAFSQTSPGGNPQTPPAQGQPANPAGGTPAANNQTNPTTNNQNPAATSSPFPVIESTDPDPAEIARGTGLTFRGQNLPTNAPDLKVFLNGKQEGVVHAVNATTFIWTSPDTIDLGPYNMSVKYKDVFVALPNPKLLIYNETGKAQPKITAVVPLVSYPERRNQQGQNQPEVYGFDVVGEGFSRRPLDNGLLVNKSEIKVCWEDAPRFEECKRGEAQRESANTSEQPQPPPSQRQPDQTYVTGKVVNAQQLHFEWNVPERYRGGVELAVRVGQSYSDPFNVTLSRVAALFPKLVSVGVVLALFGIILWALNRGFRKVIAGKKYSILSALFLDTETDTYSLSRLQFFIWTAVAILAYLYLLLSRSLVQGQLEFVDVPSGLPAIVLVSAGTTVVAQAITNTKGPKGAGEVHPSLTDLVSTGGVIVPERFQFFVWTIIGAAVFVFLVFLHDPGIIKDLPQVPTGFLALMGVSSAGYLGGKAARSAGPIIDEIVARLSSLELAIKGRVLSKDASFRINDDDVDSDMIEHLMPEIVEPDEQGPPNTAKLLRVRILTPKPEWLKDGAKLTVINPDGQKAAWAYHVGPASTQPIQIVKTGAEGVVFTVKGVNLSSDTTATIESPEGTPWPETVTSKFSDPDTIEVTTQKNPQSGVLVLTNKDQRAARIPFTVQ